MEHTCPHRAERHCTRQRREESVILCTVPLKERILCIIGSLIKRLMFFSNTLILLFFNVIKGFILLARLTVELPVYIIQPTYITAIKNKGF